MTSRIVVIGAGPIGLDAAVSASLAGVAVTLIERGDMVGAAVRSWSHVKMFSPNAENMSQTGQSALAEFGIHNQLAFEE